MAIETGLGRDDGRALATTIGGSQQDQRCNACGRPWTEVECCCSSASYDDGTHDDGTCRECCPSHALTAPPAKPDPLHPGDVARLRELRRELTGLIDVFEDLDSDAERIAEHVGNRAHELRGLRLWIEQRIGCRR